ncbi:MAG TPA: hypothetical protein VGK93_12800 [Candidatus Eisenbacteria bacterium]
MFLCLEHHDQFDSRTSQSKGLTAGEIRRFQEELVSAIEHAWKQPVSFASADLESQDAVSGRWIRGDDFDSAEFEVERGSDSRVRIRAFALHGKTWNTGPTTGDLDFEGELVDERVTFVDKLSHGHRYSLVIHFMGNRVVAEENGAFGYFGAGAHFGGEYHRPR